MNAESTPGNDNRGSTQGLARFKVTDKVSGEKRGVRSSSSLRTIVHSALVRGRVGSKSWVLDFATKKTPAQQ